MHYKTQINQWWIWQSALYIEFMDTLVTNVQSLPRLACFTIVGESGRESTEGLMITKVVLWL